MCCIYQYFSRITYQNVNQNNDNIIVTIIVNPLIQKTIHINDFYSINNYKKTYILNKRMTIGEFLKKYLNSNRTYPIHLLYADLDNNTNKLTLVSNAYVIHENCTFYI